ncbi:hypothetical protein [Sediminicola sp. 1XM1-17]|uniref:hypothetical protein n=1 Tax=Sediminicola sp. 1XM1-17 TaxID=3127702 RepID=UPI003077ABB0
MENSVSLDSTTLVLKDSHSNMDSTQVQIIKEEKTLKRFLMEVNKTRKPGIPVPEIDFSKDMLILVCVGEQHGDLEPSLSVLKKSDSEMVIEITKNEGVDSSNMAISTPFFLYRVPVSEKKITLKKRDN